MINHTNLTESLAVAQQAGRQWQSLPIARRGSAMREVRAAVVRSAIELCELLNLPQRSRSSDTVSAELIPLCDGLRFLERRGHRILAPRRVGPAGRPMWLWGTRGIVTRDALGRVLILAPWNFPLMLPGIQAAQALVGGNSVLWKPAPGCEAATATLIDCFQSVVGTELIQQVDSDPRVATSIIEAGVEKVVLTGSSETGRRVSCAAATALTPTIMELGGADAMVLLRSADIGKATTCLGFGLRLNGSATCIAPRRVFVHQSDAPRLIQSIEEHYAESPAAAVTVHPRARSHVSQLIENTLELGGKVVTGDWNGERFASTGMMDPFIIAGAQVDWPLMQSDVFAPVASICEYTSIDQLHAWIEACPYALAASVFGDPAEARVTAAAMRVGSVTINDVIVPTADPRVPFGGRRHSGHGSTRGEEGLLAMTSPKVIMTSGSSGGGHQRPPSAGDEDVLSGYLRLAYGSGLSERFAGLKQLYRGIRSAGTSE